MKPISDFLPDVLPHVPGCPRRVVINELTKTIRRFCRDTHAWVEEIERFTATEFDTYEVFLDADRELVAITSVEDSDGQPIRYDFDIEEMLVTLLDPAKGKLVIVKGALQPDETATQVIDWLVTRYREGIAAGALERLVRMKSVEWSDPNMAPVYNAEFRRIVGEARARKNISHNEQQLSVTPRSWI